MKSKIEREVEDDLEGYLVELAKEKLNNLIEEKAEVFWNSITENMPKEEEKKVLWQGPKDEMS